NPGELAIEDVDGDGALDLLVLCPFSQSVNIFPGNGDGTFGTRQLLNVGPSANRLLLRDLNGDGRLDLLVGSSAQAGGLRIFFGQEGGFLGAPTLLPTLRAVKGI